jgi:hypothetical protein
MLFAAPTFVLFFPSPEAEKFSELRVLDSEHTVENYPFTVKVDDDSLIYVTIENHLRSSAYFTVYVKLRNQTDPLPDTLTGVSSALQPLCAYRAMLPQDATYEQAIQFSFDEILFEANVCRVQRLTINGCSINPDTTAVWDAENNGFYVQLFFELWLYRPTIMNFQFQNRFVGIWLNMTRN